MDKTVAVEPVDIISMGTVVGTKVIFNESRYMLPAPPSIAVGRNRIRSTHQRNRHHVPTVLQIFVALLHIRNHVIDFSKDSFFKDLLERVDKFIINFSRGRRPCTWLLNNKRRLRRGVHKSAGYRGLGNIEFWKTIDLISHL
jgi:hypothetical protein